ncbi:hypothetical protein AnigIFM63604_011301 [Aspergillus niger]|uniref:Uncharacterized protein n=1 Tax=Aspergillus niger TaxID=5061 RepID=A0A9W5ZUQ4_ASPNG|nr:hypothetical protein AnigIFM63604_011301 [Aspergillus niger]
MAVEQKASRPVRVMSSDMLNGASKQRLGDLDRVTALLPGSLAGIMAEGTGMIKDYLTQD